MADQPGSGVNMQALLSADPQRSVRGLVQSRYRLRGELPGETGHFEVIAGVQGERAAGAGAHQRQNDLGQGGGE